MPLHKVLSPKQKTFSEEMTMAKMKVMGESGLFAKIGKRNLVLICAVLFIGLAVVLNLNVF